VKAREIDCPNCHSENSDTSAFAAITVFLFLHKKKFSVTEPLQIPRRCKKNVAKYFLSLLNAKKQESRKHNSSIIKQYSLKIKSKNN